MNDYSSLAPNSTAGGEVNIGKYSAVGIGASILHKRIIGDNCIIGSGSVVTKSTKNNSVCQGIPQVCQRKKVRRKVFISKILIWCKSLKKIK